MKNVPECSREVDCTLKCGGLGICDNGKCMCYPSNSNTQNGNVVDTKNLIGFTYSQFQSNINFIIC